MDNWGTDSQGFTIVHKPLLENKYTVIISTLSGKDFPWWKPFDS